LAHVARLRVQRREKSRYPDRQVSAVNEQIDH
jgi:hypothetical protein